MLVTEILQPNLWEEIYIPPIQKLPKHGRYPLEGKPYFNPKQAEREFMFTYLIRHRLQLKLKEIVENSIREPIQKSIQDTTRLYPPLDREMGIRNQFLNIARSWFAPSALEIFKSIELLFRRGDVSTDIRQELWTFMIYHAFHSSTTEKYLISLYRTNEFRQVLIGYMTDLYNFDQKLHGLAWPMHERVLNEKMEEVNQVPLDYHNFFMYHDYLLKLNKNELMELLDRDVLISQLKKNNFHTDLVIGLRALPQNWRYQNKLEVFDLIFASYRKLMFWGESISGKEEKLSSEIEARNARELQAFWNVLLHLRAYGGREVVEFLSGTTFSDSKFLKVITKIKVNINELTRWVKAFWNGSKE